MSNLPKIVTQVVLSGTKVLGRAFYEAGRQAYKNTQYKPAEAATGEEGASAVDKDGNTNSTTTAGLTRSLKMTLSEAQLILNVKDEDSLDKIKANYEHLFAANSPPKPDPDAPPPVSTPATAKAKRAAAKNIQTLHSHYLQSKVFRALERIESEHALWAQLADGETPSSSEAPVDGDASASTTSWSAADGTSSTTPPPTDKKP
ncbi:Uncharacterized conserved protein [Phaffia rhodozyma]|uniref:Mitochondrial import inner membrane translocase subunit TIM16 n=1 Tax=Phaffia rhodozyma TaxID=264483 RepID=A0A0F7SMK7_PHARH|nr:Uncharacterized conserved protein [Phaffia rhodozyma]